VDTISVRIKLDSTMTDEPGEVPSSTDSFPESVLRSSVDSKRLLRPSWGRPLGVGAIIVVPVWAVTIALVTWWALVHIKEAPAVVLLGDISAALLGLLLIGMIARLEMNYGVAIETDGVSVYDRTLNRHRLVREYRAWAEIKSVAVRGILHESVEIETDGRTIWLDRLQARAAFSDPRCPLRYTTDPAVLTELGVELSKSR
jgi:hypothetical protein